MNINGENEKYYLGVDIGGTSIYLVIMNQQKEILHEKKMNTMKELSNITEAIDAFLAEKHIDKDQLIFIGFGVPGTTNSDEGIIIDAPALQWGNVAFRKEMMKSFTCPIYVDNDVNCAAFGEKVFGQAKDVSDFIYIAIGTGVGAAIFANDRMIKGKTFEAGEVGYFISDEDVQNGHLNSAGEFGLLESKISGTALTKTGYNPVSLFEEFYKGTDDAEIKRIVYAFQEKLAITIANLVSLLNPEKVVISGGVALSLRGLLSELSRKVSSYTPIQTEIVLSPFGDAAGAIGAIAMGLEQNEK